MYYFCNKLLKNISFVLNSVLQVRSQKLAFKNLLGKFLQPEIEEYQGRWSIQTQLEEEDKNQLPGSVDRQSTAASLPLLPTSAFFIHRGKGTWCKLKILISTTIAMNLIPTGNNEHLLSTKYFPDTELIALLISSHLILSTIFWQRDYCLHSVDV